MAKEKSRRAHKRFNILHLKYIKFEYGNNLYPVVDISYGGFSFLDKEWCCPLYKRSKVKRVRLLFGGLVVFVDAEIVSVDSEHKILGVKIIKYHMDAKARMKMLTRNMEKAAKDKFFKIKEKNGSYIVKTRKFTVKIDPDGVKIKSKSFFTKKEDVLVKVLGFITGLPRKKYQAEAMLGPVLKSLEGIFPTSSED